MRKGVAIYGATDEALGLIPLLESSPEVEIAVLYDSDPAAARERIARLGARFAERLGDRVTEDPATLIGWPGLAVVIDAGQEAPFTERFPRSVDAGLQVVSPLTARLLWGYGPAARERKGELLQALREIVESVNLTVDADQLYARVLEIAVGVLAAEGGSIMLLDPERNALSVRIALGVEPELWDKIRVPIGHGISGRVVAEARPVHVRGRADPQLFRIVRERFDVEDALCVPLVHDGSVLGVLNLHHRSAGVFSDSDLEFAAQLGRAAAQIIARSEEHRALRSQAHRYEAVTDVRRCLAEPTDLEGRLRSLCALLSERLGDGVVSIYLAQVETGELRLAATSLRGGGFPPDLRIASGQGLDGRAAEHREPIVLRDPTGALAYLALPLVSGTDLQGVLSAQVGALPKRRDDFGRGLAAEETLREIAAAAADEIAHSWRERRMATRATQIGAINEAGVRLVSARELSEVARLSTASGALILEADHAILRLEDAETGRYAIRSYYGSADARQQEQLFGLDKQVTVAVIQRGTGLLVADVESDGAFESGESGVRSAVSVPLLRDGHIVGILSFYDKLAPDQFYPGHFGRDDLDILQRYASYVERALANARLYTSSRDQGNFDEGTGLPNEQYLGRRIDQELARAGGRPGSFAIATCRIENLSELRGSSDAIHADRVVRRSAESLKRHLRAFDVLARSTDDEFAILLPDPGTQPDDRVARIARDVAEDIVKDEALNRPTRVALVFGYTAARGDEETHQELLRRAREPRIRML